MNLLLLTAHSIAEYDDLRMFADMGIDTFSIGSYTVPNAPGDPIRPGLDSAPIHPELAALCEIQRAPHDGEDASWAIDWAKADLHPGIIEWADVIVVHHYLDRWVIPQWAKLKHKRVVWRTCGQSDPALEMRMRPLREKDGLQIVRYSPNEEATFRSLGAWAGSDALIRFGKYPDDFPEWTGEHRAVGNVTQDLPGRGNHVGLDFWKEATHNLVAAPAGPKSESLPGGMGELSYDEMIGYLQSIRAYLYLGTVPASYTLGLIEALMAGVPVVSIGADAWLGHPGLLEAPKLCAGYSSDTPRGASKMLAHLLQDPGFAERVRDDQRASARLFHIETVAPLWADFLA